LLSFNLFPVVFRRDKQFAELICDFF